MAATTWKKDASPPFTDACSEWAADSWGRLMAAGGWRPRPKALNWSGYGQDAAFRNHVEAEGMKADLLTRDRDGMFINDFDKRLKDGGADVKVVSIRAANMNAFVERWIQSNKHECLNHLIVFGEDHFNLLVSEYVTHYLEERPHQNMENKPLSGEWPTEESEALPSGEVICRRRLGGMLKH